MDQKGLCPTIYGPKQSRRQGLSLGINLGDPERKVCNWGCVYCQCGFGERADLQERRPSRKQVLEALDKALNEWPRLDSVTFAGNSEPTSHPEFGAIVHDILALRKRRREGLGENLGEKWILNMLTNGSELDRDDVVAACDALDEAWVKLDCADEELYRRMNRPVARLGGVKEQVARIRRLREPRIQTLLWRHSDNPALANFTEQNVEKLLDAYRSIRPVMIHLTTVQRDPAWEGIIPATEAELESVAKRIRTLGLSVQVYPA